MVTYLKYVGAPTFPYAERRYCSCRCGALAPPECTTEVVHLQKAFRTLGGKKDPSMPGMTARRKGSPPRPAMQERQTLFGVAPAGVAVALVLAPAAAAAARAGTIFSASFALRSISM